MSTTFSKEEETLLILLSKAIVDENPTHSPIYDINWTKFLTLARKHAVLPLLMVYNDCDFIPSNQHKLLMSECRASLSLSYPLLSTTNKIISILNTNGIKTVLLKGAAAARFYPYPELRKSGDIDLLIHSKDLDKVIELISPLGFTPSPEQKADHHYVLNSAKGLSVELHISISELTNHEFNSNYISSILPDIFDNTVNAHVIGWDFPVSRDGYLSYELLLHMLQHFLRAGFGLKLLTDWVVLWNHEFYTEDINLYLKLIHESKLEKFSQLITSTCIHYLGLCNKHCPKSTLKVNNNIIYAKNIEFSPLLSKDICFKFLKDIFDGAEFGNDNNNRMVTMNGSRLTDYIKEFHRQMIKNHPKTSRHPFLWPALWIITLVVFLRNNRKLRHTSSHQILRKAKERSELMKQLGFKVK